MDRAHEQHASSLPTFKVHGAKWLHLFLHASVEARPGYLLVPQEQCDELEVFVVIILYSIEVDDPSPLDGMGRSGHCRESFDAF